MAWQISLQLYWETNVNAGRPYLPPEGCWAQSCPQRQSECCSSHNYIEDLHGVNGLGKVGSCRDAAVDKAAGQAELGPEEPGIFAKPLIP
jgi:hypothetical protein